MYCEKQAAATGTRGPLLHTSRRGSHVSAEAAMVKSLVPLCVSLCCQVELQRLRREEEVALAAQERQQLGDSVRSLEQELAERQAEVQALQVRGPKINWQQAIYMAVFKVPAK